MLYENSILIIINIMGNVVKSSSTRSAEAITSELGLGSKNDVGFLNTCRNDVLLQDAEFKKQFGNGQQGISSDEALTRAGCILDDELYPTFQQYYKDASTEVDATFCRLVLVERKKGTNVSVLFSKLYKQYKIGEGTWADINFESGALFSAWRAAAKATDPPATDIQKNEIIDQSFAIVYRTNLTNSLRWNNFKEKYSETIKNRAVAILKPIKERCSGLRKLIGTKHDAAVDPGAPEKLQTAWNQADSALTTLEQKINVFETS